jgi:hypothetical protein
LVDNGIWHSAVIIWSFCSGDEQKTHNGAASAVPFVNVMPWILSPGLIMILDGNSSVD